MPLIEPKNAPQHAFYVVNRAMYRNIGKPYEKWSDCKRLNKAPSKRGSHSYFNTFCHLQSSMRSLECICFARSSAAPQSVMRAPRKRILVSLDKWNKKHGMPKWRHQAKYSVSMIQALKAKHNFAVEHVERKYMSRETLLDWNSVLTHLEQASKISRREHDMGGARLLAWSVSWPPVKPLLIRPLSVSSHSSVRQLVGARRYRYESLLNWWHTPWCHFRRAPSRLACNAKVPASERSLRDAPRQFNFFFSLALLRRCHFWWASPKNDDYHTIHNWATCTTPCSLTCTLLNCVSKKRKGLDCWNLLNVTMRDGHPYSLSFTERKKTWPSILHSINPLHAEIENGDPKSSQMLALHLLFCNSSNWLDFSKTKSNPIQSLLTRFAIWINRTTWMWCQIKRRVFGRWSRKYNRFCPFRQFCIKQHV